MDQRDVQIIVELYRQPFASHSTLGRAVGLTGKAVQARLERMTRAHVLNGFYVMPSAAVFRRHWQVIPFGPLPIEPPLEQLLAVEDVVNVWRGSPRTAMVNVYSTAPDSPPPPRLAEILNVRSMEVVAPDPPDRFSFAQSTLSSLDWRVLDAMLENPREPLARIAERSGLTARTVRRHRDSLWAKGLVSVVPNLDTTGESGLLVYSGFVVATQKTVLGASASPWAPSPPAPPPASGRVVARSGRFLRRTSGAGGSFAGASRDSPCRPGPLTRRSDGGGPYPLLDSEGVGRLEDALSMTDSSSRRAPRLRRLLVLEPFVLGPVGTSALSLTMATLGLGSRFEDPIEGGFHGLAGPRKSPFPKHCHEGGVARLGAQSRTDLLR